MSQGRVYFPEEKNTLDQVNLLVEDDEANDAEVEVVNQEAPKKQCPYAKPGKKILLLSVSAFIVYHMFGYCADYMPSYDEAGEYMSQMTNGGGGHHNHGSSCNPTIPYKVNQTFEFDPKEFKSFGVGVFGNGKHNSVTFVRHDSDLVTFEPEIYIDSIATAENIHVGTRTSDNRFGFGIKGPNFFKGHTQCFKSNIVISIPKSLDSVDKVWIRLPSGHISSDFGGELAIKKLHYELGAGDIEVKDKTVDEIELTTGCGKIELNDATAQKVALYTRKGDITARGISSADVIGGTADGNVHLVVKNAKKVLAKNINGDSTIKVESLAPIVNGKGGYTFVAGSINGNTHLCVVDTFKGRFAARTFNGEAKVESKKDSDELHFSKKWRSSKVGYKGDNEDSASYAESATFNGSPKLVFY